MWMPTYLTEQFGLAASDAALATTVMPLLNMLGVFLTDRLVRVFRDELRASCAMFAVAGVDIFLPWALRLYIDAVGRSENGRLVLAAGLAGFLLLLLLRTGMNIAKAVSWDRFGKSHIRRLTLSLQAGGRGSKLSTIRNGHPAAPGGAGPLTFTG